MLKRIGFGLLLVFSLVFVCAFASPPQSASPAAKVQTIPPYPVDSFEDANFNRAPEWFVFDSAILKVEKTSKLVEGDKQAAEKTGSYALSVKGTAAHWYVGGMGTMLGLDATKYQALEMDVFGGGEESGRIKVELYDDDNNNKDIEVDSKWIPQVDDLWSYEINVNWDGWKHISVPFPSFLLANPGKGNEKFDPSQKEGSGGLVKMQLIFLANSEKGDVNFSVDNIELTAK